jgi:hypothetical protein
LNWGTFPIFIYTLYAMRLVWQKDFNSYILVPVSLFLSEPLPTNNLISVSSKAFLNCNPFDL